MRRLASCLVLTMTCASAPATAGFWPAAWDQTKTDAASLVTIDRAPSAAEVGLGLTALGVLALEDKHLASQAQRHLPDSLVHLQSGGTAGTATLVAVALVGEGLALGDRRGTIGGLTLIEGNILLDLVLKGSKSAFGRVRPNRANAGEFFKGGDSFPSSHAAHAFLIAAGARRGGGPAGMALGALPACDGRGAGAPPAGCPFPHRRRGRRAARLVDRPPPLRRSRSGRAPGSCRT